MVTGADQLLLVSSSDPAADAVVLHRAAIEAAVEVGVGRAPPQGAPRRVPPAPTTGDHCSHHGH